MPSIDKIPVYLEGQSVGVSAPLKILGRSEVRQLKKEGAGYFVSNGRAFVLYREAAAVTEASIGIANDDRIRDTSRTCDESASIQPPTMNAYVAGRRTARAAVDYWRNGKWI